MHYGALPPLTGTIEFDGLTLPADYRKRERPAAGADDLSDGRYGAEPACPLATSLRGQFNSIPV